MLVLEAFHLIASALLGALATLLLQEFMPERIKNRIRINIKRIRLFLVDAKVPSRFTWKYHLDAEVSDIESLADIVKKRLTQTGFNTTGLYKMIVEAKDGTRFEIALNYNEEETRLISAQVEVKSDVSVRNFSEDLLLIIESETAKDLLEAIREAFREALGNYKDLPGPDLYIEFQLKGLSSLSILVEELGIKLALADSRYKLLISEAGVSLLVRGFTKELLGLLRNLALLYA